MKVLKLLPIFLFYILSFYCNSLQAQLPYDLDLVPYVSGFNSPVDIAHANDDRLFIVERTGRIRIITANGNMMSTPFLDIDDRVHNSGNQSEQGLLGLAFHPDYQNNGYFYVHYIANNDDSVIARFSVNNNNPNTANPNSELMLMVIDQPFTNHNGGTVKFGSDGYLYIGMGDGGSANDPMNLAQNPQSYHGKMLRIDVDNGNPYAIPPSNPFASNPNFLDEIFALGLRNPWKFSFDRQTGDMWIGDVGQGNWEEIDFISNLSTGGENFGWRCFEGSNPFNMNGCNGSYLSPIVEYNHQGSTHCSVTGGYVYRGPLTGLADLGVYFYADYCSGRLWGSWFSGVPAININTQIIDDFQGINLTSFGEDSAGNLYASSLTGQIYRLDFSCAPGQQCPLNVSVISQTDASCFGAADGTATIEASSGQPPYSYDWPTGQSTATVTDLPAFTYTVTVTDASNNTGTATVVIGQPNQIEISIVEQFDVTCNQTGGVRIAVNGDNPPMTIQWSNGSISMQNFGLDEPGIYTVVVTDNNDCSESLDVEIGGSLAGPNFDLTSSNDLSCDEMCTTLEAELEEPNGNYTYEWELPDGSTSDQPLSFEACNEGFYVLVVTDVSTGCSEAQGLEILGFDPDFELNDITTSTLLDCNNPQLTLAVESPEPNVTYLWFNQATGPQITIGDPGLYTVTATNEDTGCTKSLTIEVTIDEDIPTAVATVSDLLTCDVTVVTLNGSSSAQTNVSFEWSTLDGNIISGVNDPIAQTDQPGLYTLTVTNLVNGCVAITTVLVSQDVEVPMVSITSNTTTLNCNQTTIDLQGSVSNQGTNSTFTFFWTDDTNQVLSSDQSLTVTEPGTYTLSVLNNENGCEGISTIVIDEQADIPSLNINSDLTLNCNNPTLDLTAVPNGPFQGFIFVWTGPNGFAAQGMTIVVEDPGTYTVMLVDPITQCSSDLSVDVVSDFEVPVFELVSSGNLNCLFSEVTITIESMDGLQGAWSGPGIDLLSGSSITVNQPGVYCTLVRDPQSGCLLEECIIVEEDFFPPLPDVVLPNPGPLNCNGDAVAVNFDLLYEDILEGIPHTYSWSTSNGNIVSGANGSEVFVNAPGEYCLTVTIPGNGCSSQSCMTIEGAEIPNLQLSGTPPTCFNDNNGNIISTVDSGTMPYIYAWSNGATTAGINGIGAGAYTLLVTDENGCTVEETFTLNAPEELMTSLEVMDESSAGANDGSIVSTVTGGTPPYSYLWSNGQTTPSISNLAPGNYSLTVMDSNGCMKVSQATVSEFGCDLEIELIGTNISCFGEADGAIDLNVLFGTAPYQYFWSNGAFTEDISGLQAGSYAVSVFDANNCEVLGTIVIEEPEELTGTIEVDGVLDCLNETVGLNCVLIGGTFPYSYQWSDGQQNSNIEVNGPGTWTVIGEDANGCMIELSATVTSNIEYPLGIECLPDTILCNFEVGEVYGDEHDLGDGFSYQWTLPNGSTESTEFLAWQAVYECGDYTRIITNDATGCYSKQTYRFACPPSFPFDPQLPSSVELNCNTPSITLEANVFPIEFETFEWIGPDGNVISNELSVEIMDCGLYTFTIYSIDFSCPQIHQVEATCNFVEPIADAGEEQSVGCAPSSVFIGGTGTSMGFNFEYIWTDAANNFEGSEPIIEVNECGQYTLVVTNTDNGCTHSSSVIVQCDGDPPQSYAGEDQVLDCLTTSVTIGSDQSSTANLIYTWTDEEENGLGNEILLTVDECGIYTLTVTDVVNGCFATDQVEVLCNMDLPIVNAGDDIAVLINCTDPDPNFPITLDGSASEVSSNDTFMWTTQDGEIVSGENTLMPVVATPGTYTLMITSQSTGCTNSDSVVVSIEEDIELPMVNAQISDDIIDCNATQLDGTGSSVGEEFEYLWTDEMGNVISTELSAVFEGFGIFTLTVTNTLNGCSATETVLSEPFFDAEVILVPSCIDIQVQVNILQGTAPYIYSWDNATSSSESSANYPFGESYGVTIEDAIGCELVLTGDLPEGPEPIATTALIVDAVDVNTGSIDISVTGGSAPYAFAWSNGESTEDIEGLSAGEYTVTITDANGCEHVETFVVEIVNAIEIVDHSSPVQIYPNPSTGLVNIISATKGFDLEIVDLMGVEVYVKDNLSENEALQLNLNTGVYFVKLKSRDEEQFIAKLIVQTE